MELREHTGDKSQPTAVEVPKHMSFSPILIYRITIFSSKFPQILAKTNSQALSQSLSRIPTKSIMTHDIRWIYANINIRHHCTLRSLRIIRNQNSLQFVALFPRWQACILPDELLWQIPSGKRGANRMAISPTQGTQHDSTHYTWYVKNS